jgi:hypothetical protein
MEFRVGLIPRALWSAQKGSAHIYRHAALTEMARERAEAMREAARRAQHETTLHLPQEQSSPRQAQPARGRAPATAKKQRLARNSRRGESARQARIERALQSMAKEEPPHDVAGLRLSLTRKLALVLDQWRDCPARICHRYRRCASQAFECNDIPPRKPLTPAQDEAALAHFQRDIRHRLAQTKQLDTTEKN